MKRFLFAIAMLLITSVAVQAQKNNAYPDANNNTSRKTGRTSGYGDLKIRSSDNAPITVTVDRSRFEGSGNLVRIGNLTPRRYRIQVFLEASQGRKQQAPLHDAYMQIDPSTSYYVIVDRRTGRADIKTARLTSDYILTNGRNKNVRYYYEEDVTIICRDSRDRRSYNNEFDNRDAHLTAQDLSDLKNSVDGQSFSVDKMNMLKNALRYESYTTAQVLAMMDWLSFESDKFEFVQWAYNNVVDLHNYWKVESGFTFSSTKNDFNNFLNGKS